jgi:hypothetical protein
MVEIEKDTTDRNFDLMPITKSNCHEILKVLQV